MRKSYLIQITERVWDLLLSFARIGFRLDIALRHAVVWAFEITKIIARFLSSLSIVFIRLRASFQLLLILTMPSWWRWLTQFIQWILRRFVATVKRKRCCDSTAETEVDRFGILSSTLKTRQQSTGTHNLSQMLVSSCCSSLFHGM